MSKKVILFGATGKVGRKLLSKLSRHDFSTLEFNSKQFDFCRIESIETILDIHSPDVIINAAAFNGLEACAYNPARAITVNAAIPTALAQWCDKHNVLYVGYGTDYLWEGAGPDLTPISEEVPFLAKNVYPISKAFGVQSALQLCPKSIILNVSSIYDESLTGPLDPVLQVLKDQSSSPSVKVKVFKQTFTPTSARLIADATIHAIENTQHYGMFNFAVSERTTREKFAHMIVGHFLKLPIEEFTYFEPFIARPQHCQLDCTRFKTLFKYSIPDIKSDLMETFPASELDRILDNAYRHSKVVQS